MMRECNRKNNVLLVFPPLGNHEHPHMGLAVLKSYLTSHGFTNCRIVDYNVVIMNRLFKEVLISKPQLFGNNNNMWKCYEGARKIMLGEENSDKLKSGMAMKMIARYLRIAGVEICKQSFDPISFHAIENAFMDLNVEKSDNIIIRYLYDEVLQDIVKKAPTVIGFSVVFPSQILYTMLLCRELRKVLPGIKIFLGGAQVSLFYIAFLHSEIFRRMFDVIVREQGEIPVLKLLQYFTQDIGTVRGIPNLAYVDKKGNKVISDMVPSICMEEVGIPDYSDYPLQLYAYPKLPYMFSRGCYWGRCKFCGYRGERTKYIKASIKKIIFELKYMKERYGIRIFHLMDDAIDAHFLAEIASEIIRKNIDICYAAFLRTDKGFTPEICRLLYKSGLRTVLFGVESADDSVLKAMDKGMNLSTITKVLDNFSKAGIMNTLSIIIGFPQETKEQAKKTIEFLAVNRHLYYEAFVTPFRLMSDMIETPELYGIYDVDLHNPIRHDVNGYVSLEYTYHTRVGMTPFEYMEYVKQARKITGTAPVGAIFFR